MLCGASERFLTYSCFLCAPPCVNKTDATQICSMTRRPAQTFAIRAARTGFTLAALPPISRSFWMTLNRKGPRSGMMGGYRSGAIRPASGTMRMPGDRVERKNYFSKTARALDEALVHAVACGISNSVCLGINKQLRQMCSFLR